MPMVTERESLAKLQIEGSVALYNILHSQNLAYLADEVGMGKTYVSLGTIALMRKKKPDLRVLYLLPKNNVRDKWVKDYKSFIEHNYKHDDLVVRSLDRSPAAPYVVCAGLEALIREAAMGNNQDIFICSSALSFSLGNDAQSIKASLNHLDAIYPGSVNEIHDLLGKVQQPNIDNTQISELKEKCKQLWARAINRILPKFDLIVVDEAHNFKRGLTSSDRNKNLATILGTDIQQDHQLVPLINKVLLLSATPYEYGLEELYNQLKLFGSDILSGKDDREREGILPSFMVRRLNELHINGKKHTRNMYRIEHRTGAQAEVQMNDAQKLFAALMQKRISEHLRENFAGKYQTGLLASFESYVPSTLINRDHAAFDGDEEERKDDAKDDNVISQLISSYEKQFNQMPPHPKMDWVVKQLHDQMYSYGKKQLIFVRRVASVYELKRKFEEYYDKAFIRDYINNDTFVKQMHSYYLLQKYSGQFLQKNDGLQEDVSEQESDFASDDFFTWFYRGRNGYVEREIVQRKGARSDSRWVTPHNFRQKIAQRSTMFELNWAKLLNQISGQQYNNQVLSKFAETLESSDSDTDDQKRFQVAQYCYLQCLKQDKSTKENIRQVVTKLLKYLYRTNPPKISLTDREKLTDVLRTETFFEQVNLDDKLHELFPVWGAANFTQTILDEEDPLKQDRAIHLRETLRMVVGYICRVDHPWVDLYSIRGEVNEQHAFINLLRQQKNSGKAFCSYMILKSISDNIDLLIKLNFSDAYRKDHGDLMRYISNQIRNLQSSAGASGINSNDRSPLARRFRMPGYPMVLISTDVFQEGEDLHTFCDAVNHYGLSSSPIALEQKVGRVDRIGSMAQREIAQSKEKPSEHFIQVRYPHIKESVEYMQVQHSAYNLNQFIKSLHKINNKVDSITADIDIDCQLSAIEPQITDYLESPFIADAHILVEDCNLDEEPLECNKGKLEQFREKIQRTYLEDKVFEITSKGISCVVGNDEFEIRAARKSNELVLSVTRSNTIDGYIRECLKKDSLLEVLKEFSQTHLCRLQVKHDNDRLVYFKNVERLFSVERENFPYLKESITDEMEAYHKAFVSVNLTEQFVATKDLFLATHLNLNLTFISDGLQFDFANSNRTQTVFTKETSEYICFHTFSISPDKVAEKTSNRGGFNSELLLKYTAGRNTIYDRVDFYVDSIRGISVRAFCRKSESLPEDLLRTAYLVAREGDRLEYLFSDQDNF